MRAAIMDAPGAMRVGEWETVRAAPGEVLVSVGATGICAGDMYIYRGTNPARCIRRSWCAMGE